MMRPDYDGGSIVNLMRSVADACGAAALPYAPLRGPALPAAAERSIVLLVLDGLGFNHLQRAAAGGELHRRLRSPLTSVFPSTTAAAVTTFLTGLAPQQHALTGWHMYFRELDAVTAVLPLRPRGGGRFDAAPGELPQRLFGHAPLVSRLARRSVFVAPQSIAASEFSRYHAGDAQVRSYTDLSDCFAQIEAALGAAAAPLYVYAYYPELDALAHAHGIASPEVADHLAAIDAAFGRFMAAIRGTRALVLATADHGFIDSPPARTVDLAQHPRLAALLAQPLCGERRVAYCYLRPGRAQDFDAYVAQHLADCATAHDSIKLVGDGWFGPGAPDPRLAQRVGDRVLEMHDDWTLLDWLPMEKRYPQIGVHGGTSADEMRVPLVVAEAG